MDEVAVDGVSIGLTGRTAILDTVSLHSLPFFTVVSPHTLPRTGHNSLDRSCSRRRSYSRCDSRCEI